MRGRQWRFSEATTTGSSVYLAMDGERLRCRAAPDKWVCAATRARVASGFAVVRLATVSTRCFGTHQAPVPSVGCCQHELLIALRPPWGASTAEHGGADGSGGRGITSLHNMPAQASTRVCLGYIARCLCGCRSFAHAGLHTATRVLQALGAVLPLRALAVLAHGCWKGGLRLLALRTLAAPLTQPAGLPRPLAADRPLEATAHVAAGATACLFTGVAVC